MIIENSGSFDLFRLKSYIKNKRWLSFVNSKYDSIELSLVFTFLVFKNQNLYLILSLVNTETCVQKLFFVFRVLNGNALKIKVLNNCFLSNYKSVVVSATPTNLAIDKNKSTVNQLIFSAFFVLCIYLISFETK